MTSNNDCEVGFVLDSAELEAALSLVIGDLTEAGHDSGRDAALARLEEKGLVEGGAPSAQLTALIAGISEALATVQINILGPQGVHQHTASIAAKWTTFLFQDDSGLARVYGRERRDMPLQFAAILRLLGAGDSQAPTLLIPAEIISAAFEGDVDQVGEYLKERPDFEEDLRQAVLNGEWSFTLLKIDGPTEDDWATADMFGLLRIGGMMWAVDLANEEGGQHRAEAVIPIQVWQYFASWLDASWAQ